MSCFRSKKKNSYTVNHDDSDYTQAGGKYQSSNVAARWDAAQNIGKPSKSKPVHSVTNGNVEKSVTNQNLEPTQNSEPTNTAYYDDNRYHSDDVENEEKVARINGENEATQRENNTKEVGDADVKVITTTTTTMTNGVMIVDTAVDVTDGEVVRDDEIHLETRSESPVFLNGPSLDHQGNVVEIRMEQPSPQHESPRSQHSISSCHSVSSVEEEEIQHEVQEKVHFRTPIVQVTAPSFEAEDENKSDVASEEDHGEVVPYHPEEVEPYLPEVVEEEEFQVPQPEPLNVNMTVPDSDDRYLDSPQGTWDGRLNKDVSDEIERASSCSSIDRLEDIQEVESIPAPQEYTVAPNEGASVIHVSQLSIADDDDDDDDSPPRGQVYDFTQHQLHEQYENDKNEQLQAGPGTTTTEYSYTSTVVVTDADTDGVPEVHTSSSHHTTAEPTHTDASGHEAASIMY